MPQGLRVQIPPSAQVSGRCALRSFSEEARLAQLVERLIDVEDVVGSSPAARTRQNNLNYFRLFQTCARRRQVLRVHKTAESGSQIIINSYEKRI